MKNLNNPSQQKQYLAFDKASPEAIDAILKALNAEVDQALSQKRMPTVDGAFQRLGSLSMTVQLLEGDPSFEII